MTTHYAMHVAHRDMLRDASERAYARVRCWRNELAYGQPYARARSLERGIARAQRIGYAYELAYKRLDVAWQVAQQRLRRSVARCGARIDALAGDAYAGSIAHMLAGKAYAMLYDSDSRLDVLDVLFVLRAAYRALRLYGHKRIAQQPA